MAKIEKVLDSFFKDFSENEEKLEYRLATTKFNQKLESVSTGSISLDKALGCWGLPFGRIIQLYGRSGSGKTLMSMLAIKNAQAMDPESYQMFIDAEQTFNPEWAKKLGLDVDRIILVEDDLAVNGRRCFEMLLG